MDTAESPDSTSTQSIILAEAYSFLSKCLDGKTKSYETIHPWRKHGQFVVMHALRVEATALRLLAEELPGASEDEIFMLRLASRLHDVARLDAGRDHGEVGAGIVRGWLDEHLLRKLALPDPERVMTLIARHSQKDNDDGDILSAILKDADVLDEIGALSIFLAGNHVDRSSPDFYRLLLERLETAELPYCDRQLEQMQTRTGRRMLQERRAFIAGFVAQLRLEQEGALDAGF
jgi:HD superfamily phosphodiesterase